MLVKLRAAGASAAVLIRTHWPWIPPGVFVFTVIGNTRNLVGVLGIWACVAYGYWWRGRPRRRLLHEKVEAVTDAAERMTGSVAELVDEIRSEREPETTDERPQLRLVKDDPA